MPRLSSPRSTGPSTASATGSAPSASASPPRFWIAHLLWARITVNALVAADRVVVPVQAEYLALEGFVQFLDTVQSIRRELNPSLVLTGLLITMADDRTRLSQDVEHELREHFPDLVLDTVVPRSVRVAEAPSFALPVTSHAPSSHGAVAYRHLADEVLARG